MTAMEVCDSVETWYVKKANERNNCRLLYDVAQEFELDIPTTVDTHSYEHANTAACTTETIHNDMFKQKNGNMTILNNCVDTTMSKNGILYNMHPSEVSIEIMLMATLLYHSQRSHPHRDNLIMWLTIRVYTNPS